MESREHLLSLEFCNFLFLLNSSGKRAPSRRMYFRAVNSHKSPEMSSFCYTETVWCRWSLSGDDEVFRDKAFAILPSYFSIVPILLLLSISTTLFYLVPNLLSLSAPSMVGNGMAISHVICIIRLFCNRAGHNSINIDRTLRGVYSQVHMEIQSTNNHVINY